jgi:hypothetical protein
MADVAEGVKSASDGRSESGIISANCGSDEEWGIGCAALLHTEDAVVENERKGIGPGNFDCVTEGNGAFGIDKPLLKMAAGRGKKKILIIGIKKAGGKKLLGSEGGMHDSIDPSHREVRGIQ